MRSTLGEAQGVTYMVGGVLNKRSGKVDIEVGQLLARWQTQEGVQLPGLPVVWTRCK